MKNKIWNESELVLGFERYGESVYSRIDRLIEIRNLIEVRGISKESYNEINTLYPRLLDSVNPKKITQYPSKTELSTVIGIVDTQSFISKVRDNTIVSLFVDFISWVYRTIRNMFTKEKVSAIKDSKTTTLKRVAKSEKDCENVFREIEEHRALGIYNNAVIASQKKYLSLGYNAEVVKYIHKLLLKCDVRKIPVYTQILMRATSQDISLADVEECVSLANRCNLVDKYPIYTTAMLSGRGISSALLLRSYVGIDTQLVNSLKLIADGYKKASNELLRTPRIDTNVAHWLTGITKELGRMDAAMASNKSLDKFISSSEGEEYYETINRLVMGRVGLWATGRNKIQGDDCFNPVKNSSVLNSIFDPNNSDYVTYSEILCNTSNDIEKMIDALNKIDIEAVAELIGNYNSNSATFRNIIRDVRQKLTSYLKLSRVIGKYIEACHSLDENYRRYANMYQVSMLKINL